MSTGKLETRFKWHSEFIASKKVETVLPISRGERVVAHTTARQSMFMPGKLLTLKPEEIKLLDHTNCMRFVTNVSEAFKLPLDEEFMQKHGQVILDSFKTMKANNIEVEPMLKKMDPLTLAVLIQRSEINCEELEEYGEETLKAAISAE
jgi:hypothetical protein